MIVSIIVIVIIIIVIVIIVIIVIVIIIILVILSVTGSAPSRGAGPGAVTSSLNLGLVTREQQVLFTFLNILNKLISVQKVREYFCPNFWCLLFLTFQGQLVSCSASNSPLSPPLITSTSLNLRRKIRR